MGREASAVGAVGVREAGGAGAGGLSEPVGKQARSIRDSIYRLNIWEGSVRSGKTVASILAWLYYIVMGPPGELMMVGRTERTLKRNVLDPIMDYVGESECRVTQGTGEARIFGRRVYLAGGNDARSELKIRGVTLAGAYADEITTLPESFWTMLLSRLSIPGARLYGTTNPDSPYHWLKLDYLDRRDELDLGVWHFTLDDNPHLDPKYVESLKAEYTGLWYQRYVQGLWVLAEGTVYDMFREDMHVVAEPPELAKDYYVAVDYGTGNPTVFGLFGVRGERAWMEREYFYDPNRSGRQKTDEDYGRDLVAFLGGVRPREIIIDPSAASFRAQLRKMGFPQVRDADNAVLDGIRTQATMLSAGRYQVCVGCKETIREYGGYVWDAKAQARGEDKPMKQSDHTKDAERYFLHTVFGRGVVRAVRSLY